MIRREQIRRALVVLRGHGGEHAPQIIGEAREPFLRRRMDDVQVDRPVAMHDPVAQTGRLALGDAVELLLQLIRQLCSGFVEHAEVPQQRVAADPICSRVIDRDKPQPTRLFQLNRATRVEGTDVGRP